MKIDKRIGIFTSTAFLGLLVITHGCTTSPVGVTNSTENGNQKVIGSVAGATTADANNDSKENKIVSASTPKNTSAVENKTSAVKGDFSHIKPEHAAVLKEWITKKAGWEPAVEKDAEAVNQGSKDHPFYIVGDFNKDGKEDFAVGLVRTNNRKSHAFAVFNAPFTSQTPAFLNDKAESYDILSFDQEYGIFIGPAQSDNGYILKPNGDKYEVRMAADEMP